MRGSATACLGDPAAHSDRAFKFERGPKWPNGRQSQTGQLRLGIKSTIKGLNNFCARAHKAWGSMLVVLKLSILAY